MTTAKLTTTPAEGHGLTPRITDAIYNARAKGKPTEALIAVVLLRPVGHGERETAQGLHRHVQFEVAKLEPVTDGHQADELRWLIDGLYEQRTSTGEQRRLPLGFNNLEFEERRQSAMEAMEAWQDERVAKAKAADPKAIVTSLEQEWRTYYAMGPDDERSYGNEGAPGDYRKASVAFLLQFAYAVGALVEGEAEPAADDGDDDEPAEDET